MNRSLIAIAFATIALSACTHKPDAPLAPRVRPTNVDPLQWSIQQRALADAQYMIATGPAILQAASPAEPIGFSVTMRATLCYKVLAASDASATLDIRVTDENGVLLQRERAAGFASLGVVRAVCPAVAGLYRVDVRVSQSARVAVQTFVSQ